MTVVKSGLISRRTHQDTAHGAITDDQERDLRRRLRVAINPAAQHHELRDQAGLALREVIERTEPHRRAKKIPVAARVLRAGDGGYGGVP